jgi:sRNA-binding protein
MPLRSALAFYTSAGGYLRSCVKGTPRIDLDGDAAGFVTAGQAAWVAGILRRRRKADAAATTSATPLRTDAPRRLSPADLHAAARARREAAE